MQNKEQLCTREDLRVVTTTAGAWYPDEMGDAQDFAYEVESNQQYHTCNNCGRDFFTYDTPETCDTWEAALAHLNLKQEQAV